MKKILAILLAAMMLITCGAALADEKVTLTWMTMQTVYMSAVDRINKSIQKVYPNISVEFVHVADNYETTVKTKFATDDAPDIFEWNGYLTNKTFAEAGYFLDISADGINETVLPQFRASGMYNGVTYGIPTIAQASGLVYNKDAFAAAGIDKVPENYDELKEACEKLKAVGIVPFATGFKDVWVSHQMFWNVAGPNVGDYQEWYDAMIAGTASFLNDDTAKAFELIELVAANTVSDPLSSDAANMANMLSTGKAAMCFTGVFQYPEYVKSVENPNVGLAPIPAAEVGGELVMEYEAQGVVFAAATGKYTEEAKNVMRWIASPEGSALIAEINGQASPMKDINVQLNPLCEDGAAFINAGGKTVGFIKTYWPSGMTTEVGKQLQSFLAGTITKDEFFKNIDAAFSDLAGV